VIDERAPSDARDRLLLAAAQLLDQSDGEQVSTREICDRAGVKAPTLYHHFGDKQRLLDEVVTHGFKQFLEARRAQAGPGGADDPIADIRDAWDTHVRFGLEHPAFYGLVYGQARPGRPCGVIAGVEAMLLEALKPAARRGRLRVSPADAAAQILAASSGVTLSLITQPAGTVDLRLSERVRDAMLDAIVVGPPGADAETKTLSGAGPASVATAAITLAAALEDDESSPLSAGETALLREWLDRLSAR
jgi:AcrR family transcriptional regulator